MIRGTIAIRCFDLVKKTRILKYYKLFRSTLKWSSGQVRQYQEERLKDIVKYAYENSTFYRQRFEENNITPDHIRKSEDLCRIPPLTRLDLQEYCEKIKTSGGIKIHLKSS